MAAGVQVAARVRVFAARRAAARLVAVGIVGGMVSCLPASDLSSYSNGAPPIEAAPADGIGSDEVSAEAAAGLGEPAPAEEAPGVEVAPGTDCTGECAVPVLAGAGPEQDGALGSSANVSEDGASQNGGMLGAADGGAPVAAPTADSTVCVAGAALGPNDRCFTVASVASSWQAARTSCQSKGSGWDLARIRGAQTNSWLSTLLGTVTDAWVGASDLQTEGSWRWVGDSSAFWNGSGSSGSRVGNAYVNWNDGGSSPEPNGGDTSDCLRLRAGGGWADLQCSTTFASICEGPKL